MDAVRVARHLADNRFPPVLGAVGRIRDPHGSPLGALHLQGVAEDRERIGLYGGTMEVVTGPGGTTVLRTHLPVREVVP